MPKDSFTAQWLVCHFSSLQVATVLLIYIYHIPFRCGYFPLTCERHYLKTEFNRLGQVLGLQFDVFPSIPGYLAQLPFTDIKTTEKPVPVGPWAKDKTLKEIGRFFLVQFLEMGLEAYTLALFTRNGWSDQEVQVLLAKVRGELKSGKMHLYTFW
jgi:hypothetical protein